jgi:RHS repeat-associated protein
VHQRGVITEDNAYYPLGLRISGISAKAALLPKAKYGYQGNYSLEDAETGYNEFALRSYDPQIGRWIQADPYDVEPGMYNGMGNDWVNNVDPHGGTPIWGTRETEEGVTQYQWFPGDKVGEGWRPIAAGHHFQERGTNTVWTLGEDGHFIKTATFTITSPRPETLPGWGSKVFDGFKSRASDFFSLNTLQSIAFPGYTLGRSISEDPSGTFKGIVKTVYNNSFLGLGDNAVNDPEEFGGTIFDGAVMILTEKVSTAKFSIGASETSVSSSKLLAGFGDDAIVMENSANLASKKGWYDVVVHGAKDGKSFIVNGKTVAAEELYSNMLSNGYTQGTKIRLVSCWSGSVEGGAASQLSKLSGAMVVAPTNPVFVGYPGSFFQIGKPIVINGGVFKVFKP